jgi:hypothetical protein
LVLIICACQNAVMAGDDGYKIIYSDNDGLCSYTQDRLNKHIPNPDKPINPSSNDPFGTIKWKPVPSRYISGVMADLDINNDGENETVLTWGTHFYDIGITAIKVYKIGVKIENQKLKELNQSPEYIGSIDLTGQFYCLDQCKKNNNCKDFNKDDEKLMRSGSPEWCPFSAFTLIPFKYDGKIYIAFRDGQDRQPVKRNKYWVIVSEYRGGHVVNRNHKAGEPIINRKSFKDMCYLMK